MKKPWSIYKRQRLQRLAEIHPQEPMAPPLSRIDDTVALRPLLETVVIKDVVSIILQYICIQKLWNIPGIKFPRWIHPDGAPDGRSMIRSDMSGKIERPVPYRWNKNCNGPSDRSLCPDCTRCNLVVHTEDSGPNPFFVNGKWLKDESEHWRIFHAFSQREDSFFSDTMDAPVCSLCLNEMRLDALIPATAHLFCTHGGQDRPCGAPSVAFCLFGSHQAGNYRSRCAQHAWFVDYYQSTYEKM
jgi:hypothetical protein